MLKDWNYRKKAKLKLRFTFLFSGFILIIFCIFFLFKSNVNNTVENVSHERHLTTDAEVSSNKFMLDIFTMEERKNGAVILHLIGVLYCFVGIALACDEFFVPALEVIGDKLDLSDDVAGATLMAAGGSAPELFTSLIGTLILRNDVGFGTIVGSAVFNVLFVIAMCALAAKEVLTLTGWPLARDSSFYLLGLIILALFFGVSSPNYIEWWEAFILFILYFIYVFMMKNNQKIHDFYLSKMHGGRHSVARTSEEKKDEPSTNSLTERNASSSTFAKRTSIVRISMIDMVSRKNLFLETPDEMVKIFNDRLKGEVDLLEKEKIKQLLVDTNHKGSTYILDQVESGDPKGTMEHFFSQWETPPMSVEDFRLWYKNVVGRILDAINSEIKDEDFEKFQLKKHLENLPTGCRSASEVADDFFKELEEKGRTQRGDKKKLFIEWYRMEYFFDHAIKNEITFPEWPDELDEQFFYCFIAPLMFPMYYTTADPEKSFRNAIFTFFISIFWIGFFAVFMVEWADTLGATIGIPPKALGLTLIAAGTSVPDLLSSVIVARQGRGDMAVSSSIGSNIFDILVGLPVPWLLGNAIYGGAIRVEIEENASLLFSIVVLMLMLASTIGTIAISGWKMSKSLALVMLVLYVIFVTQDLLRAYGIVPSPF